MPWEEAGRTCLSGAMLVGDLAWEVASLGLLGGLALALSSVSSQLGRGQSSLLLLPLSPSPNLSFHFPNSLSMLTAVFPSLLFTAALSFDPFSC